MAHWVTLAWDLHAFLSSPTLSPNFPFQASLPKHYTTGCHFEYALLLMLHSLLKAALHCRLSPSGLGGASPSQLHASHKTGTKRVFTALLALRKTRHKAGLTHGGGDLLHLPPSHYSPEPALPCTAPTYQEEIFLACDQGVITPSCCGFFRHYKGGHFPQGPPSSGGLP